MRVNQEVTGNKRPKAVIHHKELVATKRPFVAWGKLTACFAIIAAPLLPN
jgi:hypothetical protein